MRKKLSVILSVLLIALPIAAWVWQDAIFDAMRLRNYSAPAEVARLADVTTMTDGARRLFYVYQPSLEDKAEFNRHCTDSEQTIVLGCYIEHEAIYLYDVPDKRLDGVEEVTAAHEMLHAAYDRLSKKERARIDALTAQVASGITDERLKQTIENYRKKDPSVVPNELHSILATEIRELPQELEDYYKRYFKDRKAVVALAESYKQEFTRREERVEFIDTQLTQLKAQIDALNTTLETQQANLKSSFERLQALKQAGSIEEYNAGVPGYNQAVVSYNANVNKQRGLVTEYNELVNERNTIAVEENELSKALDSRTTIETQ